MSRPLRSTSRGLRPEAASPSAAQPVCICVEPAPGAGPSPPSLFCARSRYAIDLAGTAARAAAGSATTSASSATATPAAAGAGRQVTSKRARQRRPEREAEGGVAERVRDVERQGGGEHGAELRERVITRVCDPERQVHHRPEREPGGRACRGERQAAELASGELRKRRTEEPGAAPAGHLPRRPRSLPEEQVRRERGDGADREARGPA